MREGYRWIFEGFLNLAALQWPVMQKHLPSGGDVSLELLPRNGRLADVAPTPLLTAMSEGREQLQEAWNLWPGLVQLDNVKPPKAIILSPRDFLFSVHRSKPLYILALMEHMRKLVYQAVVLVMWPNVQPLPEAAPWELFKKYLGLNAIASKELTKHLFLRAHDYAMDDRAWDPRDGSYGPAAKNLIEALLNPPQRHSLAAVNIREIMLKCFDANGWGKTVSLMRNYDLTIVLYEYLLSSPIQAPLSVQLDKSSDLYVDEDVLPRSPLRQSLKHRHIIYPSQSVHDSGGSGSSRFTPYTSPLTPNFRQLTHHQMATAAPPTYGNLP
jgi:hypothetical protein